MFGKAILRVLAVLYGELLIAFGNRVALTTIFLMSAFFGYMAAGDFAKPSGHGAFAHGILPLEVHMQGENLAPGLGQAFSNAGWAVHEVEDSPKTTVVPDAVSIMDLFHHRAVAVAVDVISAPTEPTGSRFVVTPAVGGLGGLAGALAMETARYWSQERSAAAIKATLGDDPKYQITPVLLVDPPEESAAGFSYGLVGIIFTLFGIAMFGASTLTERMSTGDLTKGFYEALMYTPVRGWEFTMGRVVASVSVSAVGVFAAVFVYVARTYALKGLVAGPALIIGPMLLMVAVATSLLILIKTYVRNPIMCRAVTIASW